MFILITGNLCLDTLEGQDLLGSFNYGQQCLLKGLVSLTKPIDTRIDISSADNQQSSSSVYTSSFDTANDAMQYQRPKTFAKHWVNSSTNRKLKEDEVKHRTGTEHGLNRNTKTERLKIIN